MRTGLPIKSMLKQRRDAKRAPITGGQLPRLFSNRIGRLVENQAKNSGTPTAKWTSANASDVLTAVDVQFGAMHIA